MNENERTEFRQKLCEGLKRSRYKLIREKALRNENIIEGDYKGSRQGRILGEVLYHCSECMGRLCHLPLPQ